MTYRIAKQSGRRFGTEWYDCARCGEQFPRAQMIVQRGLIVCTVRCMDEPGRAALQRGYPIRSEEAIPDLPEDPEEI